MTREELEKLQDDDILKVSVNASGTITKILSVSEFRSKSHLEAFILENECEVLPRFAAPI